MICVQCAPFCRCPRRRHPSPSTVPAATRPRTTSRASPGLESRSNTLPPRFLSCDYFCSIVPVVVVTAVIDAWSVSPRHGTFGAIGMARVSWSTAACNTRRGLARVSPRLQSHTGLARPKLSTSIQRGQKQKHARQHSIPTPDSTSHPHQP